MNFKYKDYFDAAPSTGYETLIYDCMIGDQMLFQRADRHRGRLARGRSDPESLARGRRRAICALYPAGSNGPKAADELLSRGGQQWRPIA